MREKRLHQWSPWFSPLKRTTNKPITGAQFQAKREKLGYSRKELAPFLSCAHGTIRNWEQGLNKVMPLAWSTLCKLPPNPNRDLPK